MVGADFDGVLRTNKISGITHVLRNESMLRGRCLRHDPVRRRVPRSSSVAPKTQLENLALGPK